MITERFMSPWKLNRLMPVWGRREMRNEQKTKRSYASVAIAGATICSARVGSQKMIKNWREAVRYLHIVDRARFLRLMALFLHVIGRPQAGDG